MLGFWSFPSFARESLAVALFSSRISFALPDPIQGHSATSLRTDDLFYPATARGGLVFTQPCLLQEPVGGLLDGLSPCAAFSLAWVVLHTMFSRASIILFSFLKFLLHAQLNTLLLHNTIDA